MPIQDSSTVLAKESYSHIGYNVVSLYCTVAGFVHGVYFLRLQHEGYRRVISGKRSNTAWVHDSVLITFE